MKNKILKFKKMKVYSKPIEVKFYTKKNEPIKFKALKTYSKPVKIKFYGK